MKNVLRFVIAGVVLAYTPIATAAEWSKVTENAVQDKFFIDKSSIQRSGAFVWYWEYREFLEPNNAFLETPVDQPLYGAVIRWSLDCTTKAQRLRKVNAYTKNRQLIQKFDYGDNGMLIQPKQGSSSYTVMNAVCASPSAAKPTPSTTIEKKR